MRGTGKLGIVARRAATVVVAAVTVPVTAGPATAVDTAIAVACPRQHELARQALERSQLRVDVDGDGRLDRVATTTDAAADRSCRAFVAVHVRGGRTYSAALAPSAVPVPGFRATVVGLPDLGNDPGAEIVVDTHAMADSALSQLFTLTRTALVRVDVPGRADGNVVVEGGGVTYPRGAGCTASGRLVVSRASARDQGTRFRVVRHTYPVRGDRLRFLPPTTVRTTVAAAGLDERFPELVGPHFRACTGEVRRRQ